MSEKKKNLEKAAEALKSALCDYIDAKVACVTVVETAELLSVDLAVDPKDAKKVEKKIAEKTAAAAKKPVKKDVEEDEDDDTADGTLDRDQLEGMKYNDLKKLAKELGVPAKGSRDEIIDAILETSVSADTDEDEDVEEEKPVKRAAAKTTSKKTAKKTEPEDDEDEDDSDDDDDVDGGDLDEITNTVEELVKDMEVEEIAEILADAGIKAKGKRQALIDKLIQAVADGVIELSEDDDEEDESDDDDDEDIDDEDNDEETDVNDPENPYMTEERKKAIIALDKKLRKQLKDKKLKIATMKKVLLAYYGEDAEDEIDDMSADDLLDAYIYVKQLYVDDDGATFGVEEPYTVNGVDYCCGTPLVYDDDTDTYTCKVCGSEYGGE